MFISDLHRSGFQFVIAVTGGGSLAISDLLQVPGASQSVLETTVPYSWTALVDYLRGQPDQACAARTARGLAMAAFCRARKLAETDVTAERLIGVGCTASLASDRPKRGAHRMHLAIQTANLTHAVSIELAKETRTRAEEERLVADVILHELAAQCGLDNAPPPSLAAGDRISQEHARATPERRALLLGELAAWGNPPALAIAERLAIFPGAFNPLHSAHRRMLELAAARLGRPVAVEIAIENVDKPPLDYFEIEQRLGQFPLEQAVWLTRTPTFVKKSELFPQATFVVGADTIERIAAARYYQNDERQRDAAIATLAERGCAFLVFGRNADGTFRTLDEMRLPAALRSLCQQVPEREFRDDISSTALRLQQAQQQQ